MNCSAERLRRQERKKPLLASTIWATVMLNYGLFSKMLPTATFLNTGRGAQVVEADLIRALKEQPNRAAVLDVTFPEPAEADSELYTLENVFLTDTRPA